MKISSLVFGSATAQMASLCADNNEMECRGATMCNWTGSSCDQAMSGSNMLSPGVNSAITNALAAAMGNMKLSQQTTAAINPASNSRMGGIGITAMAAPSVASANSRMFSGIGGGGFGLGQFMTCPFNVPFCERQACTMTPLDVSPLENDAYQCYSNPGCCFDETLFVYRQAFGPAFFRGVPLCYRAIDNPIFNQLTAMNYNPYFLSSIVNTVKQANRNAFTNMQARSFIGCPPRADDDYSKLGFIQNVVGNNWWLMSQLTDNDGYADFIETVSPACGWSGILEDECFLIGCCWNKGSNTCGSPLSTGLGKDRINSFMQYKMYKGVFGDDEVSIGGKGGSISSGFPLKPSQPGGLPPFVGRKRRNARDRRQANPFGAAGNLGMLALMTNTGNNNNDGNNNNLANLALLSGLGGNAGLGGMGGLGGLGGMGGLPGFGGMGGFPGFGGNQNAEVCPSREISSNCMVSTQIKAFDFSQKLLLQESCRAKGCCWDEQHYTTQQWGSPIITNLNCPWNLPATMNLWSFPSLQASVRGCCEASPCVDRQARNGQMFPGNRNSFPQPTNPPTPVEPMWTNWSSWSSCMHSIQKRTRSKPESPQEEEIRTCSAPVWSNWQQISQCSKQCGGGSMSLRRDCTGTACPRSFEYKDAPCNTQSCGQGGWGSFIPRGSTEGKSIFLSSLYRDEWHIDGKPMIH